MPPEDPGVTDHARYDLPRRSGPGSLEDHPRVAAERARLAPLQTPAEVIDSRTPLSPTWRIEQPLEMYAAIP